MPSQKKERTGSTAARRSLAFAVLLALAPAAGWARIPGSFWVTGNWFSPPVWGGMPVAEIDFSALTHVIHYSVIPRKDGSLNPEFAKHVTDYAPELTRKAHAAGVSVLLSVADSRPDADFRGATSEENRDALIARLMALVRRYGYDGVDVNWEKNIDAQQFAAFVRELRRELDTLAPRGQLTGAFFEPGEYLAPVAELFDQINVMGYDLGAPQDGFSWHSSGLYSAGDPRRRSVDWRIKLFLPVAEPSRLGLGIPFYGYVWSAPASRGRPEVTRPGQQWKEPPRFRFLNYRDIAGSPDFRRGRKLRDHAAGEMPYISFPEGGPGGAGLVTYDDEISVAAKVEYAREMGLGGVMIWELSADYLPKQNPRHPLLEAIKAAVVRNR
jgi:chitinase